MLMWEGQILNIGFIQFASGEVHFAAMLEIAHAEFLNDNSIHAGIWGSKTSFPTRMSENFQSLFHRMPRKIKRAITLAAPNCAFTSDIPYNLGWVDFQLQEFRLILKSLENIEDFSRLSANGVNPGPALANEFVTQSKSRNAKLDLNYKMLDDMLTSYLQVYSGTQNWIQNNSISKLFIFNGRFLHERAVWDAANNSGIQTMIFETTRDNLHIRELGFHNRINNQRLILNHWSASPMDLKLKEEISDQWFKNLRTGPNPFTTNSSCSMTLLEEYFVYFSNSDDEAVGFWEQWNQELGSQIDCVKKLVDYFEANQKFKLIIRLHPNLASKPVTDQLEWSSLKESEFVKIVFPADEVSSYSLIEGSKGVITFGSTIGIEAAYMYKPVMVLADCKFDELGFAFKPKDWEEVSKWLNSEFTGEDMRRNRELSRSFGFFVMTAGQKFSYSKLSEIGWGRWTVNSFLGLDFREKYLTRFYRKIILKYKLFRKAKVRGF